MSVSDSRRVLGEAKRIVIKVGSSLLAQPVSGLDLPRIASYARQISVLVAMGKEVILVSSGAVAAGCMRLGWRQRPSRVHELQAAAAVGQMGLVQAYEATLRDLGCGAAMIMLTHDDLAEGKLTLPIIHALRTASASDIRVVTEAIDSRSSKHFTDVIRVVKESGALDHTRNAAVEEINLALACLEPIPSSPYKIAMQHVTHFSANRIC